MRHSVVFIVVLALCLAACGGNAESGGPATTASEPTTSLKSTTTTATTTTIATPTTSIFASEPGADLSLGWSWVSHDFNMAEGVGGSIEAVVEGGPGLVVVGTTCGTLNALGSEVCEIGAWVSPDALAWERAPGGEDLFGEATVNAVAAGPSGVVAVGMTCRPPSRPCDAGVWFSPDGLAWRRVEQPSAFEGCSASEPDCSASLVGVVSGGPGFVATGRDRRGSGIWVSEQGTDWVRVLSPDVFPESSYSAETISIFEIESIGVAGPRIVVIGALDITRFTPHGDWISSTWETYLWTSPDGLQWERVPDPDGVLQSGSFQEPIVWDGGFASLGTSCIGGQPCDVVWTSPDGLTWTTWPLSHLGNQAVGLAAGRQGLITWGNSFWSSNDGTSWERHEPNANVFGSDYLPIRRMIWFEDVLVAVGMSHIERAPAVYVWNP